MKTKREKVADMLEASGFNVQAEDIKIVRGPKAKSDIIECWHAFGKHHGETVDISSCHTLTELASKGIAFEQGTPLAQIYGDYLVVPKPYGRTILQLLTDKK